MTSGVLYGIINAVIAIPALYGYTVHYTSTFIYYNIASLTSYAQIIFGSSVFRPFLPMLAKLVILRLGMKNILCVTYHPMAGSSSIHQISFSLFSSLSYSIGQVQVIIF